MKQLKEDGHLQTSKKGRVGVKRKVTGDLYEKFKEINRKTKGDKTYRELAALLKRHTGIKVGHATLARAAKRQGWRLCAKYTSPHLSPEQRTARLAWAKQHVDDDWHAHVDIDEKWFYSMPLPDPQAAARPGGAAHRRPAQEPRAQDHVPCCRRTAALGWRHVHL